MKLDALSDRICDRLLEMAIRRAVEALWPRASLCFEALTSVAGPLEDEPIFALNRRVQLENSTAFRRRASDHIGGPNFLSA
jgi:hypothetical protein